MTKVLNFEDLLQYKYPTMTYYNCYLNDTPVMEKVIETGDYYPAKQTIANHTGFNLTKDDIFNLDVTYHDFLYNNNLNLDKTGQGMNFPYYKREISGIRPTSNGSSESFVSYDGSTYAGILETDLVLRDLNTKMSLFKEYDDSRVENFLCFWCSLAHALYEEMSLQLFDMKAKRSINESLKEIVNFTYDFHKYLLYEGLAYNCIRLAYYIENPLPDKNPLYPKNDESWKEVITKLRKLVDIYNMESQNLEGALPITEEAYKDLTYSYTEE
jgi:hypothetical protein